MFYRIVAIGLFMFHSLAAQSRAPVIDMSAAEPDRLSHRVKYNVINPNTDQTPTAVDLDGDGCSELVIIQQADPRAENPPAILINKVSGESAQEQITIKQKCLSGPITLSPHFADINSDGLKEIFLSVQEPDRSTFLVLNTRCDTLASFSVENPRKSGREWTCAILAYESHDFNQDGHPDLLLFVYTTYAYQPRALVAYDVFNRRRLWSHPVGFVVNSLIKADLDGDGAPEFLLNNSAPDNAIDAVQAPYRMVNGSCDNAAALYIVSDRGDCLVNRPLTGPYGRVGWHRADIDNSGRLAYFLQVHDGLTPYLARFNPATYSLTKVYEKEGRWIQFMRLHDLNLDGRAELCIYWNDNVLEVRDGDLKVKQSVKLENFIADELQIQELENDDMATIVLTGYALNRRCIAFFDRYLSLKAMDSQPGIGLDDHHAMFYFGYGQKRRLLTKTSMGHFFTYVTHRIIPPISLPWGWMLLSSLTTLAVVTAYAGVRHKRYRKADIALSPVFHAIEEGLCVMSADGVIINANTAFTSFFGTSPELVQGLDIRSLLQAQQLNHLDKSLDKLLNSHPQTDLELTLIHRGTKHQVLATSTLIPRRNGENGILLHLQDISQLVQSKRAVAWATMAQKLAHEIKTPLSTIMLSAQKLETTPCFQAEKESKYLRHITDQVMRLRDLTDGLLKFAKVEKLHTEPADINVLVDDLMQQYQLTAGPNLRLRKTLEDDLPHLRLDRKQIKTALGNLLSNAINATKGAGEIRLTTRLVQPVSGGASVEIEIADSGCGIAPHEMGRLYEPFYSQSPGGTGLGLAIVKKIIDDHQGNISITSEIDVGTVVIISLPA